MSDEIILKLKGRKLDLLKEILSLDEIYEYVPEQIEEGNWSNRDLDVFNEVMEELGLEIVEAFEEEGD